MEYARVIRNAEPVTDPVKANVITDASMGPTQGVQTSPRLTPTKIPLINPSSVGLVFFLFILSATKLERRVNKRSLNT